MRCVPYHKCFLVLWKLYFKLIGFICNFIYFLLYVLQNFILKRGPEVRGPRKFKKPLSCLANRWWNNRSKCVKHLAGGVPVAAPWSSSSASCFVLNLDQGILPPSGGTSGCTLSTLPAGICLASSGFIECENCLLSACLCQGGGGSCLVSHS